MVSEYVEGCYGAVLVSHAFFPLGSFTLPAAPYRLYYCTITWCCQSLVSLISKFPENMSVVLNCAQSITLQSKQYMITFPMCLHSFLYLSLFLSYFPSSRSQQHWCSPDENYFTTLVRTIPGHHIMRLYGCPFILKNNLNRVHIYYPLSLSLYTKCEVEVFDPTLQQLPPGPSMGVMLWIVWCRPCRPKLL